MTSRVVAAWVVSSVALLVAVPAAGDDTAHRVRGCERALAKATAAFVGSAVADLGRCALAALACIETPAGEPDCLADAGARCRGTVDRLLRRERRLAALVERRCGPADLATVLGAEGLGFAALAPTCPALATDRAAAGVLGRCVAQQERCAVERLLTTALPRTGELLRIAGLPTAARAALRCLPDRGGSGLGAEDAGPAVLRCARTLARAAARFATRTSAALSACARAVGACGAGADRGCLATARAVCGAAAARRRDAGSALGRALAAGCSEARLAFATLAAPAGLGLATLADACAAVGVAPLDAPAAHAACVARRLECEVATVVRSSIPRADELLGVVGDALAGGFCRAADPGLVPTPIRPARTPRPGETATATPIRSPTPAPTATPFCGDGIIDDGEECDGAELDDYACDDLCDEPDPPGRLACRADCRFDFAGCRGIDCEAP